MSSALFDCDEGYYCPPGQFESNPSQFICPQGKMSFLISHTTLNVFYEILGHFCTSGSSYPKECGNGTYQDETRQASCKICPQGYYCDATLGFVISYNETKCLPGNFQLSYI